PGASAQLRIADRRAQLVVAGLPAPPRGRIYQVWLKHAGTRQAPEPTPVLFSVTRDGRASVAVPGDLGDVDAVLVTDEPLGGSQVPTRPTPIISARPA
ncbi:MAG: anti-sigma factor, partial [Actinomycetota bacterium]|nr:anti-sigma factor [Actinomycetota bacterium]